VGWLGSKQPRKEKLTLARGKKMPPARAATEGMAGDSTASPITCSSRSKCSSRYSRRQVLEQQGTREHKCTYGQLRARGAGLNSSCAALGIEMGDQLWRCPKTYSHDTRTRE
jgi:hypothetical protein